MKKIILVLMLIISIVSLGTDYPYPVGGGRVLKDDLSYINIGDLSAGVKKVNPDGTFSIKTYSIDRAVNVLDMHLSEKLNTVTLAAITTTGATTLTLAAGHGFVAGDFIEIWQELIPGYVAYNQTEIKSVNVNTVTLEIPMDNPFTTAAKCKRVNIKMNVDGSSTPRYFTFEPLAGTYRVTKFGLYMQHAAAGDDSKFGSLTALTNGVYFRKVSGLGINKNLYNANNNGEFRERNDQLEYTDKAGAGVYGTAAFRKFDTNTVQISINSTEKLEVCIRDNLSTLTSFKMVVQGYDANDNLAF